MDVGSADAFDQMGTLGIEEEFYIVNEQAQPTAGIQELVYENPPGGILEDRVDHELFQCTIEAQTPTTPDVSAAESALTAVREELVAHAADFGFRIAAAGLHPLAQWRQLAHATKPRYQSQLNRIQYPQHRNLTAGVHIHVGVDDADKATWIANELRWYLSPLLALSVNSPFWNGHDTGLQSARAKIFENLPNTGIPTEFADYNAYRKLERAMVSSGSIADRGELWFDVRPHTTHGTVEIRIPDAQSDPEITLAFVEYADALVADLAKQYEEGMRQSRIRRELLDANKWHAVRYGQDAEFFTRDGNEMISLKEFVDSETDRLGLSRLPDLYARESGAAKQRRLYENQGASALAECLCLK